MMPENTQSTTDEITQSLSAKLAPLSASVVSVSQDSPIEPYTVQIQIVATAGGSGSLSTQANALAAQIIKAFNLTKATVQPIAMGDDGKAFMAMTAEFKPF